MLIREVIEMTNNISMSLVESLNVRQYFNLFNVESIKVYSIEDELIGKGTLVISYFDMDAKQYKLMESTELDIKIKELDAKFEDDEYKICSIVNSDENYYKLEVSSAKLENDNGKLKGKLHFDNITITLSDKESYIEFVAYTQKINWKDISLPEGYAGKDKVDEAGAFEALCLDIVKHWGGKNLEIIGKGPDRARDGAFKVTAYSWIPILTDYSNDWILQCKYSKEYNNLQISEVYDEVTKVLMHKPDYFLLMTNRKISSDFNDWFEAALKENKYHIPFKCILINKTQLEQILAEPEMSYIKRKYFG